MAQQTINIGASPNDGTGTPLRTAFQYTNSNFSELYTALGGGSGLPGASTQVLFNNGTNIAGDAGLVYNSTTDALTIGGNVQAASATITGALTGQSSASFYTGTALPLHIRNSGTSFTQIGDNGTIGAGTAFIVGSSDVSLRFQCGGAEQMRLNSTGLGLGGIAAGLERFVVFSGASKMMSIDTNGTFFADGGTGKGRVTIENSSATNSILSTTTLFGAYNILKTAASQHQWFIGGSTQAMTLNASGNLLVARTGAGLDNTSGVTIAQSSIGMQTEGNATQIAMNRTTSDGTIVDIRRNNSTVGTIAVTTAGTTYNSISDYRLKESVAPLTGGLARVSALKPSIYKWKSNGSSGEGFIAHELAEVVPAAVTGAKDAVNEDGTVNPQGVDLSKVVPILVAAIKELAAEVNALKNA